ncbi:cytochrome P450 2D14-like isoform X1 [Hyla sarda]|uniref:cytochrome P450 2D14-like isoform X1 n=3 Tax=Hyla sarda TaxID=327740 RepID=UPI0024C25410|nr:cytochrome P450 2D14-like isoform X1 [Hyla sarda]
MVEFLSLFSNVFLLLISFIAFLFLLDFMKSRKNGSQFPPGPKGIPFLGNILQVDFRNPTATLHQLRKEFGDVYSLQYFWTKVVVLNGFDVMKETLINRSEDIADRPRFPIYENMEYIGDARGVIMARYGSSWKENRRFTLSTLRDFGMDKRSLEERVTEEAQCLCSAFKAQKDQFNPHFLINNAVANVICSIAFGDRFDYDDVKFRRLLHLLEEAFKAEFGLLAQILNEIPVLVNVPWLLNRVMQPGREVLELVKEIVSEHQKTWNPNNIRDFIDAYLVEMEKVKDDSSSNINERNLLVTTFDLFSAGTETTSTTLRWALLYMILYPDVQSKVQKEIDEVIGRERTPTMGDVLQMPYTYAVIHEVQRCGDIAPLGLPHMTYRDIEVKGYIIPKGTTVITNLSSVLKDQRVWEKPFQFYPKHFLDENGKFVKREAFMPFSAGRRSCLGEQLARMELFLFFTMLLQQLTFEIPNDQPRPREDPLYALTLSPHPYNIGVVPRE